MFNVKRWERQECQNRLPYISNAKRRKRHYFERVEIRTCHNLFDLAYKFAIIKTIRAYRVCLQAAIQDKLNNLTSY